MKKLMMLAALLAMVLAAAAPAFGQPLIDQTGDGEGELINQGEDGGDEEEDAGNAALLECVQIVQQVGGDQYGTATGAGSGDVAAANNQEFTAEQVQQCQVIVGQYNAAIQNLGDTTIDLSGDVNGDGTDDEDVDGDGDTEETSVAAAVAVAVATSGDEESSDDSGSDEDSSDEGSSDEGSSAAAAAAAAASSGSDDSGSDEGSSDEGSSDEGSSDEGSSDEGGDSSDEGSAVLPDTSGYSLIALGAGALLVAGGLVARRFVR